MKRPAIILLILLFTTATAGAVEAPAVPRPADPHRQLQQLLHRSDYQRWRLREYGHADNNSDDASWLDEWLRPWRERIAEWFRDREAKPNLNAPDIGTLGRIFRIAAWLVIGGVVVWLGVMGYRLWRDRRRNPAAGAGVITREKIRDALEQGDALALPSTDWLAEAQRLHDASDFRAVYRALYLALLSGLHARHRIDFRTNRTNWVYVNHYRGPDDDRRVFGGLTSLFDSVWYGHHPAAATDLSQLRQQVQSLIGEQEAGHA